jgi:para-nitrobenzyl esterase
MKSGISVARGIAAVLLLGTTAFTAQAASSQAKNMVLTDSGRVTGVRTQDGKVVSFEGIPFAAAPVGKLRWTPPEPVASWEGVRAADKFGASCIQREHGEALPWTIEYLDKNETSEDCLYLNVWTPKNEPGANLPVVVYVHGGAFTEGSGAVPIYDGENLARQGMVVVTINYRLGVFGFLAYPDLTKASVHHSSGNYGLLDQIAALKWVKANIRQFGGNPERVLVWGQSAGAMSVEALIASPLSANLFHAAMADSGIGLVPGMADLTKAEENGKKFAEALHANDIDALRALPADQLLKSSQGPMRFGPIADGWVLPATPQELNARGGDNDIPVITGYQAMDSALFSRAPGSLDAWHAQNKQQYRDKADEFEKLYPATTVEEVKAMSLQASQDRQRVGMLIWASRRAEHHKSPVHTYYFDRAIPWPQHPEFGAFHSGELPYFFLNLQMLDRPWTPADDELARTSAAYLKNFAAQGDPNGKGLPQWSATTADTPKTMELGEKIAPMPMAEPAREAFWKEFLNAR